MKKNIFIVIFFLFGLLVYSQTWAIYGNDTLDIEFTVISREQFNRIVTAQETIASFVSFRFTDSVQLVDGTIIRGSMPNINGYYYLSYRIIPKGRYSFSRNTANVIYGNTETGQMYISYYDTNVDPSNISLRNNWEEYVRRFNQLVRLVNGE